MIEELDLKHIFSSVKEEIATENFEKRSKLRIAEGKSKAKEWIQCDSCKFVIAAIKIYKPKTISKQVYTFPLNPWYYMTDLGYVYRLCQWDKLPTKEEKAKNENTLKWQLCCDGKAKQHQIYISKDKISIAKSLGYKVGISIVFDFKNEEMYFFTNFVFNMTLYCLWDIRGNINTEPLMHKTIGR